MSKRSVLALLVVGAVSASVLWGVLLSRRSSSSEASTEADRGGRNPPAREGSIGAVASEVRALRAELAHVRAELQATSAGAAVQAAAKTELAADAPSGQRQQDLDVNALRAGFQAVFEGQATDWAWANQQQGEIASAFKKLPQPGARLDKVECRQSMCRVDARFDSARARQTFLNESIGAPPFDHGGFYHTNYETEAVTLFLAREGHSLPSLEPDLAP
jgi:HAMP domain-containing protein